MKKKILSAVVAAAALFGAYTAQQASSTVALSDAQIENIEFLAEGEPGAYGTGEYYTWGTMNKFWSYKSDGTLYAKGKIYFCDQRSKKSKCANNGVCQKYTYHRDEPLSKLNAQFSCD